MLYISTRHGLQGTPAPLGFEDIMLAGLARDGGLYLPAEWPQFSTAEIAALKGLGYPELAFQVSICKPQPRIARALFARCGGLHGLGSFNGLRHRFPFSASPFRRTSGPGNPRNCPCRTAR